ncbi:MAG: hypothetical protein ACTHML_11705 [Ginsengibacter sp.]
MSYEREWMENGQWAIGNGQWAMGNGQWAMGNEKLKIEFWKLFPLSIFNFQLFN